METKDRAEEPLQARLFCVTPPNPRQEKEFRTFLREKYGEGTGLEVIQDPKLSGGFRLLVGSDLYDWSDRGRVSQLREQIQKLALNTEDVMPLLRKEISEFELLAKNQELGIVDTVRDGIVTIQGLEHVTYGEILVFPDGTKGMVQDLAAKTVSCILFGDDADIGAGDHVTRTGRTAGIPVGTHFLGRVVNALGEPVDGKGAVSPERFYPIERPAPGIIHRQPVNKPMETGLLSVDAMFPIGRGQRELIIGDRQTGKTAIALDTILNQRGKDVICVYVSIGQKASSLAQMVETLRKRGALPYTVVVNASASEPDAMQYIAPYSGTAIAEYFMHQGKDVLIVYDDLSKHAIAYRAISLLLERPPGREAFPGDVFYLHSRLLERSAHLSDDLGGGSLTALPIVETQAGDIAAYIPTNIISITDGQLFMESELFFAGQRPAINVGLSVSRVGGAAQTKAMKGAVGTIRLDLAQYREMEVFTQFSSDLDQGTKEQLQYGQGLMQLLRQPQYRPMSMVHQVLSLAAAVGRCFLEIPLGQVKEAQTELLKHFDTKYPEICQQIETHEVLMDETRQQIIGIAKTFLKSRGTGEKG